MLKRCIHRKKFATNFFYCRFAGDKFALSEEQQNKRDGILTEKEKRTQTRALLFRCGYDFIVSKELCHQLQSSGICDKQFLNANSRTCYRRAQQVLKQMT